jgi:uncharacterized protein involved in exopolysaccharide biosynthesis
VIGVLRLVWAQRRLLVRITAVGVLVSLVYAFTRPFSFTSTTTVMPPDSFSSNAVNLAAVAGPAAGLGSTLLGIKTPSAMFVGILESRTIQEHLVSRFDLVNVFKVRRSEDACTRLVANTSIAEDAKSGIITVSVRAGSALLASRLAAGYVEELDRTVSHASSSSARRERIFLEERLQQIKADLDASGETLSQFSSKNETFDLTTQAKAMIEAGLRLETDLMAARGELAGLRQVYSADSLRVRAVNARIAELERERDKLSGQPAGPTAGSGDSDYPTLRQLPALGLTSADLTRRVKVEEALWETLTKQYEMAKVQEAKEIPTVRVLDAANVPQRRSAPVRCTILILGTILSLLAATVAVIARSVWQNMDAEDERKQLARELINPALKFLDRLRRWLGLALIYARLARRAAPASRRSHG